MTLEEKITDVRFERAFRSKAEFIKFLREVFDELEKEKQICQTLP